MPCEGAGMQGCPCTCFTQQDGDARWLLAPGISQPWMEVATTHLCPRGDPSSKCHSASVHPCGIPARAIALPRVVAGSGGGWFGWVSKLPRFPWEPRAETGAIQQGPNPPLGRGASGRVRHHLAPRVPRAQPSSE